MAAIVGGSFLPAVSRQDLGSTVMQSRQKQLAACTGLMHASQLHATDCCHRVYAVWQYPCNWQRSSKKAVCC